MVQSRPNSGKNTKHQGRNGWDLSLFTMESLFTIDRLTGIVLTDLIIKTNVVILRYGRNYLSLL